MKNQKTTSPRSVLITGASSGIGLAAARRLAGRGWRVFAGVRKLESIAEVATEPSGGTIVPIRLDVTDSGSIAAAIEVVAREVGTGGLAGLVNNAGIAVNGPLECVREEDLRRQFDTNVIGLVAVTRGFLPLLRTHSAAGSDPTTIVNISSVSGLIAYPFLAPYAASKHAVEAISEALRIELSPWAIRVCLIEPGPIATPIWAKARAAQQSQQRDWPADRCNLYKDYFKIVSASLEDAEKRAIPAEMVAAAIEHALTSRRPRIRYPIGPGSFLARLRKFIPDRAWDCLVRWELRRMLR